MKLRQMDGVILVEPDGCEEFALGFEDGDVVKPKVRIYNADGAYWDDDAGVWARPGMGKLTMNLRVDFSELDRAISLSAAALGALAGARAGRETPKEAGLV